MAGNRAEGLPSDRAGEPIVVGKIGHRSLSVRSPIELLSEGDRMQLPEMSHSSLFPSQRRCPPDIAGNLFGRRHTPSPCGNDKPPPAIFSNRPHFRRFSLILFNGDDKYQRLAPGAYGMCLYRRSDAFVGQTPIPAAAGAGVLGDDRRFLEPDGAGNRPTTVGARSGRRHGDGGTDR